MNIKNPQTWDKHFKKGVLTKVKYIAGQIVSSIFLRPKHDGTQRLILNLKKFNETVAWLIQQQWQSGWSQTKPLIWKMLVQHFSIQKSPKL